MQLQQSVTEQSRKYSMKKQIWKRSKMFTGPRYCDVRIRYMTSLSFVMYHAQVIQVKVTSIQLFRKTQSLTKIRSVSIQTISQEHRNYLLLQKDGLEHNNHIIGSQQRSWMMQIQSIQLTNLKKKAKKDISSVTLGLLILHVMLCMLQDC